MLLFILVLLSLSLGVFWSFLSSISMGDSLLPIPSKISSRKQGSTDDGSEDLSCVGMLTASVVSCEALLWVSGS